MIKKTDHSRPCVVCNSVFVPKNSDGIKKEKYKTCSAECKSRRISLKKIKYTESQIEKVKELKKQNIPNKTISEQTGVNINKIKEIVKNNALFLTKEQAQKNAYSAKVKINPRSMEKMREAHMTFPEEQFLKKIKCIEKDILNKKGTACGLAKKYGLNPNSVTAIFRKRNRQDLLKRKESTGQRSVFEFVRDILGKKSVLYNNKKAIKPKELDIYIPTKNIGIEYNGLYWHTEKYVGKNSHYEKMKLANQNGIKLISIFADEWQEKEKQVKNFLKSVLGVSERIVGARKTKVKRVEATVAKQFINENHIQGHSRTALVYFGLYLGNELLGVMSLGRHHRKTKQSVVVLDRLCFLDGVSVQGGASKLFSQAVLWAKSKKYCRIVSWSDNRWSEGNVYKKIGFTLEEELKPDYFYVKNEKRFSKQSLKKTKEERLTNKTEKELRISQGYERIWDCGKKRWVFDLNA